MLEKPFDCGVGLTPVEGRGKEGGLSRKNVNCRAVLRKFCQGQWGVLKPKSPRIGVPRFSRKNLHYCSPHGEPSAGSRPRDARP